MTRMELVVELSATTDLTAEATDDDCDEVVNDDITVTVTNISNMSLYFTDITRIVNALLVNHIFCLSFCFYSLELCCKPSTS